MSVDQIKKECKNVENFEFLRFPPFGRFTLSFLSNDLIDPIICFHQITDDAGEQFKIKINNESFDISSNCFPQITSDCEIKFDGDDAKLQDLNLLTPLFQGNEFCICFSNLDLFQIISQTINDEDLIKIYNFTNDFLNQLQKMQNLLELEEEIFDLNLQYFNDLLENENDAIQIDLNYIARFLYEVGCSNSTICPKIAKFARDLCDLIDSKKTINKKSLRDIISEYFILRLRMPLEYEYDQAMQLNSKYYYHFYLYRQFYDFGLIDKDDLLEAIFALENYKGLCWFLDILPKHMKQLMNDLIQEVGYSYLEKISPFIELISDNDYEMFKQIVLYPESNNAITKSIRKDDVDQLQMLLNHKQTNGQSNLNLKVGELTFEVVEILNNTKLINYAAFFGSVKCFKYLLLNGAELLPQTPEFAIYSGNTEIIRIIEQKFALDTIGISMAIKTNKNDIFDWLYDSRPKISNSQYNNYAIKSVRYYNFHSFFKLFPQSTVIDELRNVSIKYGNYEILKFLNMISNDTFNGYALKDKRLKIFDTTTYSTISGNKYQTENFQLLFYHLGYNYELFQMFIKNSENQYRASDKDIIPKLEEWFCESIRYKNYFLVKFLTNYHDFSDFINNYEDGFLRHKVTDHNIPSILYLIIQNKRVDINATPHQRQGTAFTLATWESYIACARILYNRGGVDINAIGNIGETPLTGAVTSDKPGIVNLLISFDDIEVNKPNSRGDTPFKIACAKSNGFDLLKILLKHPDIEFDMASIQTQFHKAFISNQIDLMNAIYNHPKVDKKQLSIEDIHKDKKLEGVELQTVYALADLISCNGSSFVKLVRRISDPLLYIGLSDYNNFSNILYDKQLNPYYYAFKANKPETIDYLLQFPEIDVNAVHPKKNVTPLMQAIVSRDIDIDLFNRFISCGRIDFKLNESVAGGEKNLLNLFIEYNKYIELENYMKLKIKNIGMISDDFFVFLSDNHLYDYIMQIIQNGYRSELINYAFIESIKTPSANKKFKKAQSKILFNSQSLFYFLLDLHTKKEISLNFNYRNFNDNGKTALIESIDSNRPEIFDILLKVDKYDINIEDYNNMSAYDYVESLLFTENSEKYFNILHSGQFIDLLKPSYNDKSLSRINYIIDSQKDFIFDFILDNLPKEQLASICQNVDLSLIIRNIGSFNSTTLLKFIDIAPSRVLETVNNDASFIYLFIKFFMIKGYDQMINFKNKKFLDKCTGLGFDINSVDRNGETLLMCAIRNQKFESLLSFILIDGIDLNKKNKEGKDAATIAKELDHESVAVIIEKIAKNGATLN